MVKSDCCNLVTCCTILVVHNEYVASFSHAQAHRGFGFLDANALYLIAILYVFIQAVSVLEIVITYHIEKVIMDIDTSILSLLYKKLKYACCG